MRVTVVYFGVTAGSCFLLYSASRFLARASALQQNFLLLTMAAIAAIAVVVDRGNAILMNVFVLAIGLVAGMLLGRAISSSRSLLAFLWVAAISDWISTQVGPTHWLFASPSHGAARIVRYLSVCLTVNGNLVAVVGAGDLLFFTACASTLRRLGWTEVAVLAAPLAGILAALGTAFAIARPTPAIPFIALALTLFSLFYSGRKSSAFPHRLQRQG